MSNKKYDSILPALRGKMGDWVYYSCLMNLDELSARVSYAGEIHKNKSLSDMIQRRLEMGRGAQIAQYLEGQPERFFNSLVVATYGGEPNWHALSRVRLGIKKNELQHLSEETAESVGFLTFRGDEKLFAIDGQHRLAGIKKAVKDGLSTTTQDELSVILVAHKDTKKGLERTRRLFTTLNKTARPVSKGDIIALDEDDVMAICVRRLIEETDLFSGQRIAFVASNNMPTANTTSLTTIGNLYDVLTILFSGVRSELQQQRISLQRVRPNDEMLGKYFEYAKRLFTLFREHFSELDEFFSAEDTTSVIKRYRKSGGGNVLFRPIGLELFMQVIAHLSQTMKLAKAVKLASSLPRRLHEEPYNGLMWDSSRKTIIGGHKVTLREILLYMLGKNSSKYTKETLLERYRRETGNTKLVLPERTV